jgi:hypothetical protein
LPRKYSIEVLLDTDLPSARKEVYQALGILEMCKDGVLLRSQADDLQSFARELMRLPWPFTIRRPIALRKAVIASATEIIACASRVSLAGQQSRKQRRAVRAPAPRIRFAD